MGWWWWRYASRNDRRRRSSFITSVVTSIKRHILGAHIVLFNDQLVTQPASTKGQCGFPFPFFFMLRVIGRLKIFPTTKGGTSRVEGSFALEMKKEQKKKTVKGNVWKAHCLSASFGFCKGGRQRSMWTWHVLNHRATTVAKKKIY